MGSQIAGQRKVFVTNLALVRLITRVNVHMILQVSRLTETPIAHLTFEWPASIVDIHVRLEIAGRWETLGAEVALVWLLLVVRHSVVI